MRFVWEPDTLGGAGHPQAVHPLKDPLHTPSEQVTVPVAEGQ